MKNSVRDIFENLFIENPMLLICKDDIEKAYYILERCFKNGGKLLICGNGGSAADGEHIVGELMKGFILKRELSQELKDKFEKAFPQDGKILAEGLQKALPAISLNSHISFSSAFINDINPKTVYAQQVLGYGGKHDVLLAISTSGNSVNVVNAAKTAIVCDLNVISLTGRNGGLLNEISDVTIKAPSDITYKIQEYHLPIYHALCAMLEQEFFG